jgi:hypothetical protein
MSGPTPAGRLGARFVKLLAPSPAASSSTLESRASLPIASAPYNNLHLGRRVNKFLKRAAAAVVVGMLAIPAFAAQEAFDLAWSGASFGNDAVATGRITIDTDSINRDYVTIGFPDARVSSLSLTISGANRGNGTFDASDFIFMAVWAPTALDFSRELVGQANAGGGHWGATTSRDGDFNLFANNAAAPEGTWYFTLTTADGAGDHMALTSMTPATAVPEAQGVSMMLAGLGLVGFAARRRKARA